jgi:hypothetical protein
MYGMPAYGAHQREDPRSGSRQEGPYIPALPLSNNHNYRPNYIPRLWGEEGADDRHLPATPLGFHSRELNRNQESAHIARAGERFPPAIEDLFYESLTVVANKQLKVEQDYIK